MKCVTAKRIREIDTLAQEKYSIPSIILMENAGKAAAEEIIKFINNDLSKKMAVFCGRGNNGGDGFVAARHLATSGANVVIYIIGAMNEVKKDEPLINLNILRKMGLNITELKDTKSLKKLRRKFNCDIIVDAIFGTGFSGKLPDFVSNLILYLNSTNIQIISIDVPSGLDSTTGRIADVSINAAATITFGLSKTGFVKNDGPKVTGKVMVRNISYPLELLK